MKKIVSIFLTLLIMINTLPVFADLDGYVYIRSVNVRDNEMTVTAVNILNLSSSNTAETSDITVKVTRLADKCIIYERTRVMLENTAEDFVLELPENEEGVIPYGIYEVEAVNNRGDKDVWNWEHKNIIISNVYASDGKGTVEITNLSQGVTEVTVTVMKTEDGFSDDDRTYGFYQRTLWGGTTSKFKFDIPEDKNGIKPYGTYQISVRTNEGQKLQRDWTYMQYTYTENIDQKFEYLTSIGVMDETNTGQYIVRHVLKIVLGEEPVEARFFRQLSQRTFLNYVCNILGNYGFTGKYSKEAIKIAEEEGLIEVGRTDHYKPLVYEDAVKILTKALGFKDLQTEEDYKFAAESLGLLDGVAATEGGRIKTTAGESWLTGSVAVTMRDNKTIHDRCRLKWDGKTYLIESFNRSGRDGSIAIVATKVDEGNQPPEMRQPKNTLLNDL